MAQDNCVYKCTPIEGQPFIYIGLHVDDLVYYSKSNKVEKWFENNLKFHVKVDFKGDAWWFLGQAYDWHTDSDGKVSCHVSQQAFIEQMLEQFKLEHYKTARTLYRPGFKIDRTKHDNKTKSKKEPFIQEYQSIIGCLN